MFTVQWGCMPSIPELSRQRHVDLCEFEASEVYKVSSRTEGFATEKHCPKNQ